MRDQIVMSKTNGNCAIAIPLFNLHESFVMDKVQDYQITLVNSKPVAYAIDIGSAIQLVQAEYLEKNVEFVGDL